MHKMPANLTQINTLTPWKAPGTVSKHIFAVVGTYKGQRWLALVSDLRLS